MWYCVPQTQDSDAKQDKITLQRFGESRVCTLRVVHAHPYKRSRVVAFVAAHACVALNCFDAAQALQRTVKPVPADGECHRQRASLSHGETAATATVPVPLPGTAGPGHWHSNNGNSGTVTVSVREHHHDHDRDWK